ncbi:VOC family protein [Bosea vestrisii]|uniref:VOC family protein n=1 Tax=Bosea vestrisii TaxID=151416 RepID=UPI0024DF438C|nr:VOC family protein [Bosea vestrisii]WID95188.1 VOC family protein [Bosea vestrisii]
MSIFQKLHHLCVVVADIDKAQAHYEAIGIGPWQEYPPLVEYKHLSVPNEVAFQELKYRICNLPNIQIQLCEPPNKPCPQRVFLDTKGEGIFHVGFEVADADGAEAEATASGLEVLAKGRRDNGTGFTYYDTAWSNGVVLLTRSTNKPGT